MSGASKEQSQKKISSFFFKSPSPAKLKTPVVDLTVDSEDDAVDHRPEKRPKLSHKTSSGEQNLFFTPDPMSPLHLFCVSGAGPSGAGTPSRQSSPIQRYRFDMSSPPDRRPLQSPEVIKAKAARREAFKRKLLDDNDMLSRRSRLESPPRHVATSDAPDSIQLDTEESLLDAEEDESRPFPEFLQSYKSKGKQRAIPVDNPKKKKVEEIGQSGLAYTPLELQVCYRRTIGYIYQYLIGQRTEEEIPRHLSLF